MKTTRRFRILAFVLVGLALAFTASTSKAVSLELQVTSTPSAAKDEADKIFAECVNLIFNVADYKAALDSCHSAVTAYEELSESESQADALTAVGIAYYFLNDYDNAILAQNDALNLARQVDALRVQVDALTNLGQIYFDLGQFDTALKNYQNALQIVKGIDYEYGKAISIIGMGHAYNSLGNYGAALDAYQQGREISKAIGDLAGEGAATNSLGTVYENLGNFKKALEYYQDALKIQEEAGDARGKASTLGNIGVAYNSLGQLQLSLDYYTQALSAHKELGDFRGQGITLSNIGQVYRDWAQYKTALDYYQQALEIQKRIQNRSAEATTEDNIGTVYADLGQRDIALQFYQQAFEVRLDIGDKEGQSVTLSNIGTVYYDLGNYDKALEYHMESLTIRQEIGDNFGEGNALNNIGSDYSEMGESNTALEFYSKAADVREHVGDRYGLATTLNNIGTVYTDLKDYQTAREYHLQALTLSQEVGDAFGEGLALHNIAVTYEAESNRDQSIDYYKKAIDKFESISGGLSVPELKTSFTNGNIDTYERAINLLWDNHQYEEAFTYSERSRARVLLDQFGNEAIDFRAAAPKELLEREETLRNDIKALSQELVTLRDRPLSEWDSDSIAETEDELTTSKNDYAQLLIELKLQSPEVASMVSIDVTSVADIQSLLDINTTLVDYFVNKDRVLAFIITHNTFETVTIDVSRDDLTQTITGFRDFASRDNPHPASLTQLYSWLIAPLKDKLRSPLVGIIPHGVLHYLPFAALTNGERYLADDYVLFFLPSSSTLRFIQDKRKPIADTVLAFGNPATTEPGLSPLNFAQEEAESVANLYGGTALANKDATETTLKTQSAGANIIHLAAHAKFDKDNPLFSAIYLAGDGENDGRLEVHEIYGLDLTQNTDLVVLSGCDTEVGGISVGDEVVGLTRAFLYAGSPTVIASLWNVDDEPTAMLMERFYTHLRDGEGKAQALQLAQSEVRIKYPNPHDWAAFVLTGDPGTVVEANLLQRFVKSQPISWAARIIGILAILIVVVTNIRKRLRRIA